jgi:NitT/TauT family transport system substrate-binding protein
LRSPPFRPEDSERKEVPMRIHQAACWSRRELLRGLTLAGTVGLLGLYPRLVAAEPPPETTTIRLVQISGICIAPQYVAEEPLRAEGFIEVRYVKLENTQQALASGELDISMAFVAPSIIRVDTGAPLVLLRGVHVGCHEVFGTEQVRAIRDLKGKTVAVPELGSAHHLFLACMAAYVGLDPRQDIS